LPQTLEHFGQLRQTNQSLVDVTRVLRNTARPGDIVIADHLTQQQLDFVGEWRLVDPALGMNSDRMPPQPPPDASEGANPGRGPITEQRQHRYRDLGEDGPAAVCGDLFAWASNGRRVFWIGERHEIEAAAESLGEVDVSKPLATFEVRGLR